MAEITAVGGREAEVVEIDSTGGHLTVTEDAFRMPCQIHHTGKKTADSTASTSVIVGGYTNLPTNANYAAESDKFVLEPGDTIEVQGKAQIFLKSAADAVAIQWIPCPLRRVV